VHAHTHQRPASGGERCAQRFFGGFELKLVEMGEASLGIGVAIEAIARNRASGAGMDRRQQVVRQRLAPRILFGW